MATYKVKITYGDTVLINDVASTTNWEKTLTTNSKLLNDNIKVKYYKVGRLPEEYQEVQYLESSGTQYINTGLTPGTNISFDMTFEITQALTASVGFFGNDNWNNFFGVESGKFSFNVPTLKYVSTTAPVVGIKYHAIGTSSSISIDGISFTSRSDTNLYGSYVTYFKASSQLSNIKIYSLIIYSNSTVIQTPIPCYRISDNKPGMYDLTNSVFYTNAGTDEFILGPEVIN